MRRGHPGIGGWRNENPRQFRPRGGGAQHYGPPQQYPLLSPPGKFGAPRGPGPRHHRGAPHFNAHYDRDRYTYRRAQPPLIPDQRQNYPPPHMRHNDPSDHVSPYKNMLNYCENRTKQDQCHVNSMGDIDHRQSFSIEPPFNRPPPWGNSIERISFKDRSPQKRPNQYNDNVEGTQIPTFTSHRPPSSDHYGGNTSSGIENSNSFSRSVDDTVDIVRKRLMNRNESHSATDVTPTEQELDPRPGLTPPSSTFQDEPQTPPARKRIQRRQNVKSNCDKIKNKIVHQLFKMDKEKIHKLMDNPNSSSKFEYAISSLITESQNSLDRHLRSVAEKSLCSSSEQFIHNDNNTIYEDTFLKQMQCILEPQDTVLLEDIKPLVMAELNKVLQLDEFDQRFDIGEEDPNYYPTEHVDNTIYSNEYAYDDIATTHFPEEGDSYYQDHQPVFNTHDTPETPDRFMQDHTKLYERRAARKSCDTSQIKRRYSDEKREQARRSIEEERNRVSEERHRCDDNNPAPVFDTNVEQLSEEEDPFADLDRQYHVAVDHNFIEAELDKHLMSAAENSISDAESITKVELLNIVKNPTIIKKEVLPLPEVDPKIIKNEIDNQILNIAKSPLKLSKPVNTVKDNHISTSSQKTPVKTELNNSSDSVKNDDVSTENQRHDINKDNVNEDQFPQLKKDTQNMKSEISNTVKSTIPSNARKRSIDQKPSHRKEKRKKSETTPETNKQILNKNIIINVNDCSAKSTEKKCDSGKSIFNLFFTKDEGEKELPIDSKNVELSDKGYSDKYVKRKETPKKKDETRRNRSSSTSHSISPKENNNICNETQSKTDAKNKLKPIDMFLDHPKKPLSAHQAHRNTAQPIVTIKKVEDNSKKIEKPVHVPGPKSKSNKRNVATQMILKMHTRETQTSCTKSSFSKFCQTDVKKKMIAKATQTNPVTINKTGIKSNDAFERMKEIDLEIQMLLQEKFKLYNSLEAKESCSNAIQNLGMTVLNVTPIEEDKDEVEGVLSEDTIVNDFTSIPVEELEQIALETVEELPKEPVKTLRRNQRQKVIEPAQKKPSPVHTYKNRKANTPNISLIEQIITDDRPLEDIISLDDLEVPEEKPTTASKKKKRQRPSKASRKKTRKGKAVKPNTTQSVTRECFVLLNREDVAKYLNPGNTAANQKPPKKEPETEVQKSIVCKDEVADIPDVAAETVANDSTANDSGGIQFDMLDVSEDIVIGDVCEIKCSEERDVSERADLSISEDIILDNSQSSSDDTAPEAGQSENECRMFDYSSDETLKRDSISVTGNADAVLAIECVDNDFIAACLDGNVYHFNNDGQLLTTLRGSNLAVTCLTIVKDKSGTTVYTGSLDSRIRYYDLETGLEKGPECNVLSPIQTMDRAWDTVFVGTRTGFVLQFECRNNMLIPVSTVKFSEQSILALRALKEGPRKVLLVAARSDNVTIKDAQTGLLLRTLEGPKMTVYTLLYEDGKVYCGTSSHQIHVFDYASGSHWGAHEGGKGCVCLRAAGGLLLAGCYDGCVYVYREAEPRPLAQLRGPGNMLLSLALVGTKIIAGYKDRSLYIWKIPLSILKEMIL